MTGKTIWIDGDICCVSGSAAAEERWYRVRGQRFKTKKELKEAFPDYDEDEVERVIEPSPFSHVRQNIRNLVQSILNACAPVADVKMVISGPNNFRYKVATIKPYKGNRDRSAEPVWRKDAEEWVMQEYGAVRTDGYEADDLLAVEVMKDPKNCILASLDKDFGQLPFLHMYRWDSQEHIHVSPVDAHRNFYKQMLTGDVTDAIPGCPGIGKQKAEKALGKLKDEKLMATVTYSHYQKGYGKDAWSAYMENARLLYLCRTEADLEDPVNAYTPHITPS